MRQLSYHGGERRGLPLDHVRQIYADRAGRSVLQGGEIILQDRAGNVISMTSNAARGISGPPPPLPATLIPWSAHGGVIDIPVCHWMANGNLVTPADPNDLQTWLYKAWVRNGTAVPGPMVTIAPVGSPTHTGMNMSCNMHHSPTGSRGALWVSPDPTLPSYPATGLSYSKHIAPILNAKCSPCHIPGNIMWPGHQERYRHPFDLHRLQPRPRSHELRGL